MPSELFLMDTAFIKLISFPSTPCEDDKIPLWFAEEQKPHSGVYLAVSFLQAEMLITYYRPAQR